MGRHKLVKDGFDGEIIATNATRDIAKIMLLDSASILLEEYKKKSALSFQAILVVHREW